MNTLLLLAALVQLPMDIHVAPDLEGRLLQRAVYRDLYVIDEDTAAIRYYQSELRRIVRVKTPAVDNFVQVGRHKTKFEFPSMAYDSPYITVLMLKRCCDEHNARHRTYAETTDNHESAVYAGIIDLGSESVEAEELAMPWKAEYELTAFKVPTTEK